MTIIPIYNSLILEGTNVQITGKYSEKINISGVEKNDDVVLVLKRNDETSKKYYPIGFVGRVSGVGSDDGLTIDVNERIQIEELDLVNQQVNYHPFPELKDVDPEESKQKLKALKNEIIALVAPTVQGGAMVPRMYLSQVKGWNATVVMCASHLGIGLEEGYDIMKAESESEKIDAIFRIFHEAMTVIKVSREAQEDQDDSYQQVYREAALKKQIDYLQKQLDDLHPENKTQLQIIEEKIEKSGMSEEARKEVDNVLRRLKAEGENSHEFGMLYDYLEFMVSLDWKKNDFHKIDLAQAREILNRDHYGLDKVKKRIIEQLAVMALNKKQSGSIILFVGAPGTGKTSIAKSIAEALGREYARISLGGVRDEADIRGHRRTYIGAMPGRIMDAMKKTGTSNPVMVLDEIDKLSTSYNGDPASALLEVLDPEQNHTFTDHYMNAPYDLSDVLFIATANTLDSIPGPLLDRMEIIQYNGYTPNEKLQIAKQHLLKKAMEKNGVNDEMLSISDEAIEKIISGYTMEAGVRGLKKQLDKLTRIAAVEIIDGAGEKVEITPENLPDYMDQREIHHERVLETKAPGIVTGLAWTAVGGEILFIETLFTKGEGRVKITGQLGDVMRESAEIAISLVKKMYPDKVSMFKENDLHIHVPAGATPKDGPSAGITLTTALASLVNDKPVDSEYAMTGEVSLRGNVMPIGGLPEKLLAAQRAGVKHVFIPKENEYDLKDVAPEVLDALDIMPVDKIEDVLNVVLQDK